MMTWPRAPAIAMLIVKMIAVTRAFAGTGKLDNVSRFFSTSVRILRLIGNYAPCETTIGKSEPQNPKKENDELWKSLRSVYFKTGRIYSFDVHSFLFRPDRSLLTSGYADRLSICR
jgi:hypothetical protein